jgi:hypothetical protein
MSSTLPDNNTKINVKSFILDPFSVIIKLAIIGNKPIGTKILIQNNVIYLQEPGIFQSMCRIVFNSNKTDLQYIYNPIQTACLHFYTSEKVTELPRIKLLFNCALKGLQRLMDTYKNCSIIFLCLNYYYALINNHMEFQDNIGKSIFNKDGMTSLYTKEIVEELNTQWTSDKITVILDLIYFLDNDTMATNNVKSLETIMDNNDINTQLVMRNL